MTEQLPPHSGLVQTRLMQMFSPEDHARALDMLLTVTNMGPKPVSSDGAERCRLAALKLSGGTLKGLRNAVRLYQTDPRDLLMAAGFGSDLEAHLRWANEGS